VAAFLEKGAIEEVPLHPPPPSLVSNIFLVQKKNGKMCPIINLKRLNAAHLETPHSGWNRPRMSAKPSAWGLGGIHRLERRVLPRSHPCCGQEIPSFRFQFCILPFGLSPGGLHDQVFACPWASPWAGEEGVHPQDVPGFSPLFPLALS
jgi:hypothetical protein